MKCFCILCIYSLTLLTDSLSKLKTLYQWKQLRYTPNISEHIDSYNLSLGVPYDIDIDKDGRVFLTIIAREQVPISLTTITNENSEDGPLLSPYPDYTWFLDVRDCNNITNARSIAIDKCNRLWVLDTGRIGYRQICNAKLLIFNLNNNEFSDKFIIPKYISEDKDGKGVLVNPVIQYQGSSCQVEHVYIADSEGYALVIWNGNEFIRLTGPEFEPVDEETIFNISGESFTLRGGIVPMDLEPDTDHLVFAPLASRNLFAFNTSVLAQAIRGAKKRKPAVNYGTLKKQPTAMRWGNNGRTLFIGLADNSIECWTKSKLPSQKRRDTVVIDNERLQFISSLKVHQKLEVDSEEELWILTTRLQKIINGSRKLSEINFRILTASIKNLIKNTNCEEFIKN